MDQLLASQQVLSLCCLVRYRDHLNRSCQCRQSIRTFDKQRWLDQTGIERNPEQRENLRLSIELQKVLQNPLDHSYQRIREEQELLESVDLQSLQKDGLKMLLNLLCPIQGWSE
jgi:hypothetical protein